MIKNFIHDVVLLQKIYNSNVNLRYNKFVYKLFCHIMLKLQYALFNQSLVGTIYYYLLQLFLLMDINYNVRYFKHDINLGIKNINYIVKKYLIQHNAVYSLNKMCNFLCHNVFVKTEFMTCLIKYCNLISASSAYNLIFYGFFIVFGLKTTYKKK